MSHEKASRYDIYRNLALANFNLMFGRLLPNLHVPDTDLSNKTAIITGGNSGIGHQIAPELTNAVPLFISLVAMPQKPTLLSTRSHLKYLHPTLAQEWSSREDGTKTIDLLFHNAGIGSTDQAFTSDGFPPMYTTNFLGSFLLTSLLENYLSPQARIIMTSSTGQYSGVFVPYFALERTQNRVEGGFHAPPSAVLAGKETAGAAFYVNTKAMQVAFAKLLQERFDRQAKLIGAKDRKLVHSFTPGFTMTPIIGKVAVRSLLEDPIWWVLQATTVLATHVGQGAATAVWLATTQDEDVVAEGKGGVFWDRMTRMVSKVDIIDWETLERMWVRWEADAAVEWR